MIKDYKDAELSLRIADTAYRAEEYATAGDIVTEVAHFCVSERGKSVMSEAEREQLSAAVEAAIGRFTYCPDEAVWEDMTGLIDLFRK